MQQGEICARSLKGDRNACQGDSGGPLTIYKLLFGVVSYSKGRALPQNPDIYAEVSYLRDWIKNKTRI